MGDKYIILKDHEMVNWDPACINILPLIWHRLYFVTTIIKGIDNSKVKGPKLINRSETTALDKKTGYIWQLCCPFHHGPLISESSWSCSRRCQYLQRPVHAMAEVPQASARWSAPAHHQGQPGWCCWGPQVIVRHSHWWHFLDPL